MKHVVLTLALILLVALVLPLPVQAKDAEPNFAHKALASVALGEPIQKGPVILIPLVSFDDPVDPGVVSARSGDGVAYFEPDFPRRRHDLGVRNDTDKPVLLLGGTVLVGGKRDRMTRHTRIISPEGVAELRSMSAASASDARKKAVPFVVSDTLAPIYLRREGDFGASKSAVDTFVSRWLEFRNEGDKRKSLQAIAESDALKTFCEACQASMSSFPSPIEGYRVVGGVVAVRGRIQSLFLFATNKLLREYFEPLLRSATYAAAAIDIRARKAKVPFDDGSKSADEVRDDVLQEAQALLQLLKKAKYKSEPVPEGTIGESLMVRTSRQTRGRALAVDGTLVYMTVYPYDPFATRLYSKTLSIPEEEDIDIKVDVVDSSSPGYAELSRRFGRGGRLTPYETRLLDRMKGRRPGTGGTGNIGGLRGGGGVGGLGRRR